MIINTKIKKFLPFIIFIIISLLARLTNIYDSLYFTWDQGRDFFAVQKIAEGDLTLIGPTTGLQGFYLGPFWYYLGLPGYFLSNGSPYIFSLWYIFITLSALPLFWILSKALFKNKRLAAVCAYMLSLAPSSIWGTIRVWNPMISIPLMIGVYLSLLKARKSNWFLALGFLLLGLVLQSEFAYAIFFCAILIILIPWIKQRIKVSDFLIAILSLGITLLPQIAFEIRHNFIMTNGLKNSFFGKTENKITWKFHLSRRPLQLVEATKKLLIGNGKDQIMPFLIICLFLYLGFKSIKFIKKDANDSEFIWSLLLIMAIIPYPFYLLWKGNSGYFFEYYLTPHFIFLIPFVLKGIVALFNKLKTKKLKYTLLIVSGFILTFWYQSIWATTIFPKNNAGYKIMDQSIDKILEWIKADEQNPGVVRIFTPNRETEHYDAILHWNAKKAKMPIPHTIKSEQDANWYILIEPDYQLDKRLNDWYSEATSGGILTRKHKIGDLTLESWVRLSK